MTWNIQATVWGGITGFRQGLVKDKDGKPATYTLEEARTEAARLNTHMNRHPSHSPSGRPNANFSYIPVMVKEVSHASV